jgi:hypothetical protein
MLDRAANAVYGEITGTHGALYRTGVAGANQERGFDRVLIFIAVLRYVDPCPGLPCHARRPFPAERRPKFISVAVWGALFSGVFNLVQQVQPL